MPSFDVTLVDVAVWIVAGLIAGAVAGMVLRGGKVKLNDALFGLGFALLGGVAGELVGIRGTMRESLTSVMLAFFTALVLTLVVRMVGGRFAD
jgi:hypothetical protein